MGLFNGEDYEVSYYKTDLDLKEFNQDVDRKRGYLDHISIGLLLTVQLILLVFDKYYFLETTF